MPSFKLSSEDANDLKEIVVDYLQGEPLRLINNRLLEQAEDEKFRKNCALLYREIPLQDKNQAQNDYFVEAILSSLNIKKVNKGEYSEHIQALFAKSDNLYDFLKHLHHEGHHHLGYLLKRIDNTSPEISWAPLFFSGAALSAGAGALFYFKPDYLNATINWINFTAPEAWSWVRYTFLAPQNVPLIGIAYHVADLLIDLYYSLSPGLNIPMFERSRLGFKGLGKLFFITANLLSFFAGGLLTQLAAIFIILGSGFDIVDSIVQISLIPHASVDDNADTDAEPKTWGAQAALIRAENLKQRLWHILTLRLCAASLIVASTAVACLLPPNLVISISCFIFGWCVSQMGKSLTSSINNDADYKLQRQLKNIKTKKEKELRPQLQLQLATEGANHFFNNLNTKRRQQPSDSSRHLARRPSVNERDSKRQSGYEGDSESHSEHSASFGK